MSGAETLTTLVKLELELHRYETRRNRDRLHELLHDDFEEIGRSGRRYSRADILAEFAAAEESSTPVVVADQFDLGELADDLALLTYRSAHQDGAGTLSRYSLRSSLWVRCGKQWRMRFHQGTPAPLGDGIEK